MIKSKKLPIYMISFLSLVAIPLTVIGSTYAAWAVTDNAGDFSVNITPYAPGRKRVSFYTSYTGSSWGGLQEESVVDGEKVTSVPTVSLSGYTFKGWIEGSAPDSSHYTATVSSSTISTTSITADKTYYPILESNDSVAYDGSSYHNLNSDVTLTASSVASVKVGKRYLGISGIPNASASVNTSQNLYSSSGIYQFHDDGKIFRKIGFQPNNDWRDLWSGQYPSFSFHTWGDYGDYDYLRPFDAGNYIYYAYIPATNHSFKIIRQAPDASSINWSNNQTANISLSDTFGAGSYSSSSIIMGQYGDSGWTNWGASKIWWFNP